MDKYLVVSVSKSHINEEYLVKNCIGTPVTKFSVEFSAKSFHGCKRISYDKFYIDDIKLKKLKDV